MPYVLNTAQGRVSALIGAAEIRGADGKMHPLKLGDIVRQGDLLLTSQDGIVQITPEPVALKLPALPATIEQTLVALEKNLPQVAPAAILLPSTKSVQLKAPGLLPASLGCGHRQRHAPDLGAARFRPAFHLRYPQNPVPQNRWP